MRTLLERGLFALFLGLGWTVFVLFAGLPCPPLTSIAEAMLAPGFWLPNWYWGGVGDPLQLVLALALDVGVYGLCFFAVLSMRARFAHDES